MNTTTERSTIAQFIASRGITAESARVDRNPNMDDTDMDHWRVTLRAQRRKLTVYFSMGYGHHGEAPRAADVLDCLASDAGTVENARGFEDWCSEIGYDTDSRKAHRTYTIRKRQGERLRRFLGDEDYGLLLWRTERL